jgi:Fic family protein
MNDGKLYSFYKSEQGDYIKIKRQYPQYVFIKLFRWLKMIRKVITDVYEDVHFSDRYDSESVGILLRELDVRHAHFTNLPIVPEVREFLHGELLTSSVFSTAAIGKPDISETQVRAFLEKTEHYLDESQLQIVNNIKRTFEYADNNFKNFQMSPDSIRKIHMMLTIDTEEGLPGVFRNKEREVRSKDYTPPKASLQELTEEFCKWFVSSDMMKHHPAVRAFLAHYHIGMLQPFSNGNGRTARIAEMLVLNQAGMPHIPHVLSQYYRRNRKDYIKAFIKNEKTGGFDMTPFLVFCLEGAVRAYKLITDMAVTGLRAISVKEYIRRLRMMKKITERQKELLEILYRYDKPFDLHELLMNPIFSGLYKGVTENTARNDIKRLRELNLIRSEKDMYVFNRFVLG